MPGSPDRIVSQFILFLGLVFGGVFAFTLIRYGLADNFLDHGEPALAARTWRMFTGLAMYNTPADANYQVQAYGPMAFLVNVPLLWLFGGSLGVFKLGAALALIGGVALLFAHGLRLGGREAAVLAAMLAVTGLMRAGPNAIWARPEPFLFLLAAAAVTLAAIPRDGAWRWPPLILTGVCLGIAMNMKIHAAVYFAPVLIWSYWRRWWIDWPLIGVVAVAAFAAPFAHPLIDFGDWLSSVFDLLGDRRPDWGKLESVLVHGAFVFASPALMAPFALRSDKAAAALGLILLVMVCLMIGPSLSPGAGWYYMLPFLPVTVDAFLRLSSAVRMRGLAVGAFGFVFAVTAIAPQVETHRLLAAMEGEEPGAEALANAARHPGKTMEIGVGETQENYSRTWVSAKLVFAGHPGTLAPWSNMDSVLLGHPLPPAKEEYIVQCRTDLWLIPAGEAPFAMESLYPGVPTYWPAFRQAFMETYEKIETGRYFDVWACRKK